MPPKGEGKKAIPLVPIPGDQGANKAAPSSETPKEKDLEAAIQAQRELDSLVEIEKDIGLSDETILDIAANERLNLAVSYQRLYSRLFNTRASVESNERIGNKKAADHFRGILEELERDRQHILRSIGNIDRQHKKAKARMQIVEAVQRASEQQQMARVLEQSPTLGK